MVGRDVINAGVVVDDDGGCVVVDDVVVDDGCVVVDVGVVVTSNVDLVVLFCTGIVAGVVVVLVMFCFLYLQSHIQYVDSLASFPS